MDATGHDHHEAHAGHDESGHHHGPMPTSGRALNAVSLSATLHCLTGCAIGEVLGMIIGTALGFSDLGTIALAVALAFLFGYSLTSLPLLRAGFALTAVVPIALASDTFSITVMEIVDNAIMLIVPGAMESGVGDVLFWGALSFALVVAGLIAFPVNRWLIQRGKGHTAVHNTGVHGGPPVKLVGVVVALMAVFGTTVLVLEALEDDGGGHGGGHEAEQSAPAEHGTEPTQDAVRGLSGTDAGMTLALERESLPRGRRTQLAFTIDEGGSAVREFETEHERRLHLIVVRRDMDDFQHLHPQMSAAGRWSTPLTLSAAGVYRVFADFKRDGRNVTLARDVTVSGRGAAEQQPFPAIAATATTDTGYEVRLEAASAMPGEEAELAFNVTRAGRPVDVERYLGADGHLVALREGDLAYLHVHPAEAGHSAEAKGGADASIRFDTTFPTAARYALFLQFKHDGRVHTAGSAREVSG